MSTIKLTRGMAEDQGAGQPFCYLVTDIETDGPEPGGNSMLSFASVIVDQHGQQGNAFEACLEPLPDARSDPDTLAWLQSQPEVWADATRDPLPAEQVIQNYVQWIRELPTLAVFVAHPLAFDGFWIDWYLRRFAGLRLVCGPYGGERLFLGAGLDLPSLLMGVTGWDYTRCRREYYPEDWYGGYRHTHRAIDDARGYAQILGQALRQRTISQQG
jgi:hypothetical protein